MSVSSSRTTVCPQFLQVYVPLPGFSPVVDIFFLLSFRCTAPSMGEGALYCEFETRDQQMSYNSRPNPNPHTTDSDMLGTRPHGQIL